MRGFLSHGYFFHNRTPNCRDVPQNRKVIATEAKIQGKNFGSDGLMPKMMGKIVPVTRQPITMIHRSLNNSSFPTFNLFFHMRLHLFYKLINRNGSLKIKMVEMGNEVCEMGNSDHERVTSLGRTLSPVQ